MSFRRVGKKTGESWRSKANCKDADLNIFFPTDEDGEWIDDLPVKDEPGNPGSYCLHCKVQEQCLEYAVENDIVHGIFGGTNEIQRKRLINNAKKQRRLEARRLKQLNS